MNKCVRDSEISIFLQDCDQKSARCYTFNCSLGELKPGRSFVIRIRSRLWNSTFLEVGKLSRLKNSMYLEVLKSQVSLLILSMSHFNCSDLSIIILSFFSVNVCCSQDYPDVDAVVIYSKAEVKIDPELNIKQTSMDNDVLKVPQIFHRKWKIYLETMCGDYCSFKD